MAPNSPPDQPEVTAALEQLTFQDIPLMLTRTFGGLLLKQDVQVVSVFEDAVQLQAEDLKAIAAPGGRDAYLHHRTFSHPAQACLQTCDLLTNTFTLSNLAWTETDWHERSQERVQPRTPTYVTVRSPSWNVEGAVLDVNASGLGMLVRSGALCGQKLRLRSGVHLDIQSPQNLPRHPLLGTIVHSEPISRSLIRVGIRFQRIPQQARFLKAYTSLRIKEILKELDRAYERLLEPRHVEDLYF